MTAPGTRYPPGSLVRCREREWVVLPPDDEDVLLLRPLAGDEAETAGVYLPLVRQGVETVAPATFPPPDPARRGDLAAAQLLWDAARLALRDGAGPFRSLGRLSVRPRAYQYVPLLLALRLDPVRMLIADDVGIGKTIEAALVARELLARGEIRRVCVLCPPYLADQWREELATKFHLSAEVVRSATAAGLERRLPPGADSIFAHYRHLVVSIDYAKSDHHRHAFLAHCADFVIVDEAHGAAAGGGKARTQRHELVASVARDPKRHLLLLTATPHSGFEAAFRSLLALVDPALGELDVANLTTDERGQLARYFVQRRRADVADWVDVTAFPRRLSVEEPYSLSGEYKSLFRDVYAFAHELIKSGEGEEPWHRRLRHWTALALLRCVMSSPASAIASLEARLGRSGGHAITPSEEDAAAEALDAAATPMVLEPSSVEAATDVSPGGLLAAGEMDLGRGERRRLRDLARRAQELAGTGADAKLAKVVEVVDGLLADGFHPIVWCRFIATSDYVAAALEKHLGKRRSLRVASVTGALSEDERRQRVAAVCGAKHRVLVATDCLSEGVNLQEHFSAVVHYDLPWNPNRLEQREGRVDRFGQQRAEVRAVLLYGQDNPIDGAVLEVLLRKAKEIYRVLGTYVPVPVNSESVVDAILRALLLKSGDGPVQLELLDAITDMDLRKLHLDWDLAAQREKKSRTRFAQRGIKPEAVRRELEATDSVLGDVAAVERFVRSACQRLGAPLKRGGSESAPRWRLDPALLPAPLRHRLGEVEEPWRISFSTPAPDGAQEVGRNHPLVAGLANYLLEEALQPGSTGYAATDPKTTAARTALVRTRAVKRRTTLLLLRLRYLLVPEAGPTMLAEEVVARAFRGRPGALEWLAEDETQRLLGAEPAANVTDQEAAEFLGEAVAWLPELAPEFQAILTERSKSVQEAHARVQRLARRPAVRARAHDAPDVLGLYVLLPAVGAAA